jgi:hypothetical protein
LSNQVRHLERVWQNILMESYSKAKAPHATTYYHYLLLIMYIVSLCLNNVSIFTKWQSVRFKGTLLAPLVQKIWKGEFKYSSIEISHYFLQLGSIWAFFWSGILFEGMVKFSCGLHINVGRDKKIKKESHRHVIRWDKLQSLWSSTNITLITNINQIW